MSFQPANNPCPCESGREFHLCCGTVQTGELKIFADLSESVPENEQINLTPALQDAVRNIAETPDLFPVKLTPALNEVIWVKMSPYWFSESTFLNPQRIMGRCALRSSMEYLSNSVDDKQSLSTPYIFHSAFCGSTLMSRGLELIYNSLPLREPQILCNLLYASLSGVLNEEAELSLRHRIINLLARRFEPSQVPVVKANDYSNAYLEKIMTSSVQSPILLMYSNLNEFIAGCLKSEDRINWVLERFHLVENYFQDIFENKTIFNQNSISNIDKAAVYWSYNIKLFSSAIKQFPDRIKTLDIEQLLASPLEVVDACGEWFGLEKLSDVNAKDEINWLMGVHAKETRYKYSPEQRKSELNSILEDKTAELVQAEIVARVLLGNDYPDEGLPQAIMH